ncbi:MAG: 2-oxo acid dehydrogenase subunit E2 [Anaerolineae bacterium]|nr:2-oxo acid dehydrogenase subunit E2 [Anaerolineae bacterium]
MSNFTLPPLGDGIQEVTVIRWIKQIGDQVAVNEAIAEVETDKITLEIAADRAGKLGKIVAEIGKKVRVGDVLAALDEAAAAIVPQSPQTTPAPAMLATATPNETPYAGRLSPVVNRMLAEHQLDPNRIIGTGENGRITKHDVLAHLEESRTKNQEPRREIQEPSAKNQEPRAEIQEPSAKHLAQLPTPHSPMRMRIAEHMMRSLHHSAQVTTVFEVDLSAVAKHREANKAIYAKDEVNLTWLAYIASATAHTLRRHRMVNSEWRDEGLLLKSEINLGIAVALQDGLMVPVIQNADELNLKGLARQIQTLAQRARNKQLQANDLQGGTFSISNHGASGSLFGTPVLNQGQTGILGVGAVEKRVKVLSSAHGDVIAIRPCAYLSFTFDHRVLDGANADAFMADLKHRIETWGDSAA